MLDRTDIESDIARGDPEDVEVAFDALVGWHAGSAVAGVADAEALMALFKRVCEALVDDPNAVPPETARALARNRGPAGPHRVDTYAQAARLALAASRSWWPAFAASFPET